jgi:hypothetical protein
MIILVRELITRILLGALGLRGNIAVMSVGSLTGISRRRDGLAKVGGRVDLDGDRCRRGLLRTAMLGLDPSLHQSFEIGESQIDGIETAGRG